MLKALEHMEVFEIGYICMMYEFNLGHLNQICCIDKFETHKSNIHQFEIVNRFDSLYYFMHTIFNSDLNFKLCCE